MAAALFLPASDVGGGAAIDRNKKWKNWVILSAGVMRDHIIPELRWQPRTRTYPPPHPHCRNSLNKSFGKLGLVGYTWQFCSPGLSRVYENLGRADSLNYELSYIFIKFYLILIRCAVANLETVKYPNPNTKYWVPFPFLNIEIVKNWRSHHNRLKFSRVQSQWLCWTINT